MHYILAVHKCQPFEHLIGDPNDVLLLLQSSVLLSRCPPQYSQVSFCLRTRIQYMSCLTYRLLSKYFLSTSLISTMQRDFKFLNIVISRVIRRYTMGLIDKSLNFLIASEYLGAVLHSRLLSLFRALQTMPYAPQSIIQRSSQRSISELYFVFQFLGIYCIGRICKSIKLDLKIQNNMCQTQPFNCLSLKRYKMSSQQNRKRRSSQIFSASKTLDRTLIAQQSPVKSLLQTIQIPAPSKISRLDHLSCGYDPADLSQQDIYNSLIPFFLRKSLPCKCISSLTACGLFSQLINPRKLTEMETEYERLLDKAEVWAAKESLNTTHQSRFYDVDAPFLPGILFPHMVNLKKLVKLDSMSQLAVSGILNHAKSGDLTFWMYCELVSHMPLREQLRKDLKGLLRTRSRTLTECLKDANALEYFVENIHRSKGANLIPVEHYARFVVLLLTNHNRQIFARTIFCYLIHIKNRIVQQPGNQMKVINYFMRSPQIDWQTIISSAEALGK